MARYISRRHRLCFFYDLFLVGTTHLYNYRRLQGVGYYRGRVEKVYQPTELNLNYSTFRGYNKGLSALETNQYCDHFLFYKCSSKVLRKVSIKNAMYDCNEGDLRRPQVLVPLPQKALIKFVRNGPASLRYFRSDLTPENVKMLRLERPEIVFL